MAIEIIHHTYKCGCRINVVFKLNDTLTIFKVSVACVGMNIMTISGYLMYVPAGVAYCICGLCRD